jgi:hypothetical protein
MNEMIVDDISRENAAISAAWREHKAEPSDAENHVTCCLLDGFTAGKRFAQPSPEAIRRVAERIADGVRSPDGWYATKKPSEWVDAIAAIAREALEDAR